MARRAKSTPHNTSEEWRLNILLKDSVSGRRERHFYKTKDAILEAAGNLWKKRGEFGVQSKTVAPTLAEQATKAASSLEPSGKSIVEAANDLVDALEKEQESVTLERATESWMESCEVELRSATIKNLLFSFGQSNDPEILKRHNAGRYSKN